MAGVRERKWRKIEEREKGRRKNREIARKKEKKRVLGDL